jgi:hypothetical protein
MVQMTPVSRTLNLKDVKLAETFPEDMTIGIYLAALLWISKQEA